jgi:predicted nucleic acid-binding protein
MKLYIDTNVIIDLLAKREAYYKEAIVLFESAFTRFTSTTSILNTLYVVESQYKIKTAKQIIGQLLNEIDMIPVSGDAFTKALHSNFKDIEDGTQYFAALEFGDIDYIITRDLKGFSTSEIPVLSPKQFIKKHLS